MSLLNRLKIWQKLVLLVAALGIPIVLLTYLLIAEKNLGINFAYQEIQGVKYLQPVRALLQHLAEHRGMSSAYLNGDASFREKITTKRIQLAEDMKAMDAVDTQYGAMLDSTSQWQAIKATWEKLQTNALNLTAKESFAQHTALIEKLLSLNAQVSIKSNLVFDSDPGSYQLIGVIINQLPLLVEKLGQLRAISVGIIARRQISKGDQIQLGKRVGQVDLLLDSIQTSLDQAFNINGLLKPVLGIQRDTVAASVKAFLALVENLAHSDQVDTTQSASQIFTAATQAIEAGFKLYDATTPALMELLQSRIAELNEKKFTGLASVLLAVILALLLAYGITRVLNRSLRQAQQVASHIAAGELNHAITIASSDEIGQLLGMLETTQKKLTAVVEEINTAAETVHSTATEIAQGSADLSQRTEEQASALEETASAMEQLTSTVKHSADNAGQANQLANAARTQAEQGGQVVNQAITAMSAIHQSSRKIAEIIGVIDEIAFQTNLLALNAAVEAARAGEQGRGFAVVAGEVRKLAQRSADAAKQIKSLIMDSVSKVENGESLVKHSGQTLQEIVASVKKVSDIVAEIAAAAREQASGIEQVNQAILQMDQATQQNAALVEQTTAASQVMGAQAQELQQLMGFFTLDQTTPAPAATDHSLPHSPDRHAITSFGQQKQTARPAVQITEKEINGGEDNAALITWSDALSVSDPDIDQQHKKLVEMINDLHDAMRKGQTESVMGDLFNRLLGYTAEHFSYEEQRMAACNYPHISAHKARHADLVQQATALQEKFASGNQHLNMKVMRFLKDWITNHIQKSDKDYVPYLQAKPASHSERISRTE